MTKMQYARFHDWRDNLRQLMTEQKLNARKLSLKAGLNATAVRDIFKGRSQSPRYGTVQALAAVLKTTPSLLMEFDKTHEAKRAQILIKHDQHIDSSKAINYPIKQTTTKCQRIRQPSKRVGDCLSTTSLSFCTNSVSKPAAYPKAKSWNMRFLDFIEQSNRCSSQEQVIQLFENALSEFGIDRFVYSLARGSFTANGKTIHGLARSYPEGWMKHYTDSNYIDNDPTYRHALKTKGPFSWETLEKTLPLSKKEKLVMNEAKEAGLKNGVTLSLHGPYGEVVGFGLARKIQSEELNRDELSVLYALANQFHMIHSSFNNPHEEPPPKLTDRQREVLQWSALGKSRDDIADIMGVSGDTVDDHFKYIFKKLGCNDKTLAGVKAVYMGLIRI